MFRRRPPQTDPLVAERLRDAVSGPRRSMAVRSGWTPAAPRPAWQDEPEATDELGLEPLWDAAAPGQPGDRASAPGGEAEPVLARSWSSSGGPAERGVAPEPDPPGPPAPEPLPRGSLGARWRAGRRDPGRRGVAALALVGVLAAGFAAVVVLRARPHAVRVPEVAVAGIPVPGSAADRAAAPSGELVVFVGGKVPSPGLVRLPAGSRVDDAVHAAGGAVDPVDLQALNPARKVSDGEQILVGVAAPSAAAGSVPGAAAGPLDLNAASVQDLDGLPGIGPVLAQKIVDYRTENGRFASIDQLREVPGIGEAKYSSLKAKVRV